MRSSCKAFSQLGIKVGGPIVGGAIPRLVVQGFIRKQAKQTQKWMFTVSYWIDHTAPMEELEKVPKELKGTATL